jgi:hypothetical protein
MKKRIVLTSLLAIVATCGAARAETDVTFAGGYTLENGTPANVATPLANATYTYTKSNGSTSDEMDYNVDPVLSDFTYTDKDGVLANLSTGIPTQSEFTGDSAADNTVVWATNQDIVSGATVSASNYEYQNGKGEKVVLGATEQNMTQTIALDATYAGGVNIDVVNGTADTFDGTVYTYTSAGGEVYHLSSDGAAIANSHDEFVTPETGSALETAFNEMKAAFVADTGAVDAAKTTTAAQWATEQANFAAANAVVTTDTATVATLDGYYQTLETAKGLLTQANSKQAVANETQTVNMATQTAAQDLYNSSIVETVAAAETNAKEYADSLASNYDAAGAAATAETNAKDYADGLATNYDAAGAATTAETNAKNYADSLASNYDAAGAAATAETNAKDYSDANLVTAKDYADSGDVTTLASAKDYSDANLVTAKDYADSGDATTLASAKEYSDANLVTAKDYADSGDATTLASAKEYSDANLVTAKGYADSRDAVTLADAKAYAESYADSKDAETLANANSYTDLALNSAKEYSDAGNALTLHQANAYTDERIAKLDKDLSAGIASSAALSSVAVSGVSKGELSVGAGFGHHNSQSAAAFGAVMGLTDRWSVNAGAGFSNADVTVRAGTNYKFKLF